MLTKLQTISFQYFTQTSHFVCVTNASGVLLYGNPAFETNFGHLASWTSPKRVHELVDTNFVALLELMFQGDWASHAEIELLLNTQSGQKVYVAIESFYSLEDNILIVARPLGEGHRVNWLTEKILGNNSFGIVIVNRLEDSHKPFAGFQLLAANTAAKTILDIDITTAKLPKANFFEHERFKELVLVFQDITQKTKKVIPYKHPKLGLRYLRVFPNFFDKDNIALLFEDITEGYNNYNELSTLFGASTDLIVIMNRDGIIKNINDSFCSLLELEKKQLIDKAMYDYIHGEDRPEFMAVLEEAVTLQESRNIEMRCQRANGTYRILSWRRIWYDAQLDVIYALGQNVTDAKVKDIQIRRLLEESQRLNDELKQKVEALHEAEKMLSATVLTAENKHIEINTILNTVIDAIITTDQTGLITSVNRTAEKLFGFSNEEFIGSSVKDLIKIRPNQQPSDINFGSKIRNLDMEGYRKDGTTFPLELSINKAVQDDGTLLIVSVVRDITETKRADEELNKAKAQIESIFQSLDNIFWSIAATKNQELLTISDAVERVLGYPKSVWQQEGLIFEKICDITALQTFNTTLAHALRDGKATCEFVVRHKDKSEKWLLAEMKAITDGHGIPLRIDGIFTDVTTRKEAEIGLASTQTMLEQILGALSDTILFVDLQRNIKWANKSIESLLGYEVSEVVGHSASILYHSINDYNRLRDEIYNENGPTLETHYEVLLKTKQHEPVWANVSGYVVFNNAGHRIGFLGVFRDITEKKALEAETSQVYSLLEEIKETLDVTKDAIFIFDTFTQPFKYTNRGAIELTGYSPEVLKSKNFVSLVTKDRREEINFWMNNILNKENRKQVSEKELIRADGRRIPVEVLLQWVEDEDGIKNRYISIVRDISDRKNAETRLKENELKFRSTFEQAALGIGHVTLDFKRATFNKQFYQIIGHPQNEGDGLIYLWQAIHQDYRRSLRREFLKLVNDSADDFSTELLFLTQNNEEKWINLNASLVRDERNVPAFIVVFLTDVSYEKQAKIQLKDTLDELKIKNFELDQFVYKTSHDLRSPLTSIMGLINVIRLEDEMQNLPLYIDKIEERVHRLDNFIALILTYSKSANSPLNIKSVDFEELVNDAKEELKYLPNAERLDIKLSIDNPNVIIYHSDPFRLGIILKNIVSNAIKYMNLGRSHNFLSIHTQINREKCFITISDNGIGIEQIYIDKIFDMFYRASEQAEGSGLGLYIVKQTVKMLQGEVKLMSKAGSGTTFLLELPNLPYLKMGTA